MSPSSSSRLGPPCLPGLSAKNNGETPPGWTETRGGTGGKVIRVTTLTAGGPGSLAEAIGFAEPRVIEFAVGGIRLDGAVSIVAERLDPGAVAFKRFVICPEPVQGLGWVKAEHDSPYGMILETAVGHRGH